MQFVPEFYHLRVFLDVTLCRRVGHVARMGDRRGVYRVLVRRPEGKRPLGEPRRRWGNNVKIGWVGMDCIALAQDRNSWRALVNAVMNLPVP